MYLSNTLALNARLASILAATIFLAALATGARAATLLYYPTPVGGGTQTTYLGNTPQPISGTITSAVPRFNPALGTLLQADFEWAAGVSASWTSIGGSPWTESISITGPSDVGGVPMGPISPSLSDTLVAPGPSNSLVTQFSNLTLNSGLFFSSITGVGTYTMSYLYSGTTYLDTPVVSASGFGWGATAHILYTYEPVPEPNSIVLSALGLVGLLCVARKDRMIRTRFPGLLRNRVSNRIPT